MAVSCRKFFERHSNDKVDTVERKAKKRQWPQQRLLFQQINTHIDWQQWCTVVGFTLKSDAIESRGRDSLCGNCLDLFDGSIVRSGEFVLCCQDSERGGVQERKVVVGQMLSLEDRRDALDGELVQSETKLEGDAKERFALLRCFKFPSTQRPIDAMKHNQVPAIEEVIMTDEASWISTKDIQSIAFAFHIDATQ